jgi:NAD(P)H dehydrogenase (quinone)
MTIGVTGATGALGSLTISYLLGHTPASSIVAFARNREKAKDLESKGVQVRTADYNDPSSLEKAFAGVDRILLISSNEVGKRFPQHKAVIDAAKKAGTKLLVYTSIAHADTSVNPLAPEHLATESYLAASGLPYIILRNNWYTENYLNDAVQARESGYIFAAVAEAKVASAPRKDYAEAAANILAGAETGNTVYELSGDTAWNYHELAEAAGAVFEKKIAFMNVAPEAKKNSLVKAGLPEETANFVVALDQGIAAGSLAQAHPDLANILGRPTTSLKDALRDALVRDER